MIPLRLVIDTNIVVSAALKPDGLQRTEVLLALTKPARWYVSTPILREYSEVLSRPELRIRRGLRLQFIQLIHRNTHLVVSNRPINVTPDPDDNKFLACADRARADYLITGNERHFPRYWKKTKVISSREFLAVVSPHLL